MSTVSALKKAIELCPVPDVRWQWSQWHCAILTGSELIV
jgi:hypothetical protein